MIPDLPNEIWKPVDIIGYGYEISDLGRCKSLIRKYRKNEILMMPTVGKRGYPILHFKDKQIPIHRVMGIYFIPNPFNLPEINHLDGIKTNYCISNLEWSTTKDNIIHAHKNGLVNTAKGNRHGKAKLTERKVKNIRKSTLKNRILADYYNVSIILIQKIKSGKLWKHIL